MNEREKEIKKARISKINKLADEIKFKNDKKTKLVTNKAKLVSLLLEELNFKEFANDLRVDTELRNNRYNGEVFTRAFKSAMESYGKIDEKTGERIPFNVIFISHYNKKKPQIKVDKYKEDNYRLEINLKFDTIKLFLQQQSKTLGNKRLPDNLKIEKVDDCIEFLKSLNADREATEKAINKLNDLFTDRYVQRVKPVSENDEDEKASMADFAGQEDQVKEAVVDKIADGLDKVLLDISNMKDKSLLQYAQYYITMKIILKYKIIGFDNQILDEYVDKDLEKFYFEKYSQYEDEKYVKNIIADYTGKKPDTERKKLDKVKKLIQNSMLKNVSR